MVLGITYYALPRMLGKPIYSCALGVLGFCLSILLYTLVGAHHFIFSPVAWCLQTVAIIGAWQPSEVWNLIHLYNPRAVVKASVMPGFKSQFNDKPIASVVNRERSQWGNNFKKVTAEDVAELRQ